MPFPLNLIIFGTGLLSHFVMNQSIPTQKEQVNLLSHVHEIFQRLQVVMNEEAETTDNSLVKDVNLIIVRATYILQLLEQITLLRLSCDYNSVCMLESRPKIMKLAEEGRHALQTCSQQSKIDIEARSNRIVNATDTAVSTGRQFLDSLGNCTTKKVGLGLISCYRGVIKTDVQPVKLMMLGAMHEHKDAHLGVATIRDAANACVDDTVKMYRDQLEQTLTNATQCT